MTAADWAGTAGIVLALWLAADAAALTVWCATCRAGRRRLCTTSQRRHHTGARRASGAETLLGQSDMDQPPAWGTAAAAGGVVR